MNPRVAQILVLDPIERYLEIVCGLVMVLSFTAAVGVTGGDGSVHRMFVSALLCNLTWGVIDAAFYLIGCLAEYSHSVALLLTARQTSDPLRAQQLIASVLPPRVAEALRPRDFERIHAHLKQVTPPRSRVRLTGRDLRGALGVFLIVFLSTLPVVVPFRWIQDVELARRVSEAIAVALLFGCGHMLARYAGLRRVRAGLAMAAIGAALAGLMIALGN